MKEEDEELKDVMVAEDDTDDFELLCDVIRSLPLQVVITHAGDGEILMKLMHENVPDLLFLDIILPRKTGIDCIREIRSDKKFDKLPIIVYTSLKDLDTIEFCYRNGTNLFIHKPNSYREIREIIEKIFSLSWKKIQYYPSRQDFVMNPLPPRPASFNQ